MNDAPDQAIAKPVKHRAQALDLMRAFAALAVLTYHVWLYRLPNPSSPRRDGWFDYSVFEMRVGLDRLLRDVWLPALPAAAAELAIGAADGVAAALLLAADRAHRADVLPGDPDLGRSALGNLRHARRATSRRPRISGCSCSSSRTTPRKRC